MRLAPYGLRFKQKLADGKKISNDIFVCCGVKAWEKAKMYDLSQFVLCLPPGDDPFNYDWPVHGCSVLVIDTGGMKSFDIKKLGYCLLLARATIVRVFLANSKMVIYRSSI